MERRRAQPAWASLDTLLTAGTLGSLADGDLLELFRRDAETTGQDAFRILVERHGAMVLGVCRGLVNDPHEAEDAFQATFLVLVRRADSIRRRETIAPWLYGVACRVARKARIRSARRRRREVAVAIDPPARPAGGLEASTEEQALQEEIRHLPESLRAPLVLCCLEGQSYEAAARSLGVTESTLRGRLHRARKRLESRLRRRGIVASAVAGLVGPERFAVPPLPPSLLESTTHFAVRWSSLRGLLVGAGTVPGSVATLAQGVINAMLLQTVKVCGLAAILTVGVVGTLVVAQQEKAGQIAPQARTDQPGREPAPDPGAHPQDDLALKTQRIIERLHDEIALDLDGQVPLDQFLKAVKRATTTGNYSGIPIYVDPIGLQEAEKSVTSMVTPIKGGPLGFVMRQTLAQLHLSYVVKDGFLMISYRQTTIEERLDELDRKIDRALKAIERIERATVHPARP